MDPISELILFVARQLGLSPVAVALAVPTVILVSRTITRAIPDTATGPLMWLRLATKYIGLHVKDNSGVPGILTAGGNEIRQAAAGDSPEGTQGVLELTDADKLGDPFKRANLAINQRNVAEAIQSDLGAR